MNNDLLNNVLIVLLSLNTSSIVLNAASGPLTKNSMATCGRYVKKNMKVVTPTPRVRVGVSFDQKGLQRSRWERK